MRKHSFCSNWTYKHLGAPEEGAPVTIPHDAMLAEPRHALAASGINGAWFEGHDYLYEKHFTPGPELQDQKLVLEFEGVYRKAEVLVNGHFWRGLGRLIVDFFKNLARQNAFIKKLEEQ